MASTHAAGRRSKHRQLVGITQELRPQRDSNPRSSLERAESWAGLDDGDRRCGAGTYPPSSSNASPTSSVRSIIRSLRVAREARRAEPRPVRRLVAAGFGGSDPRCLSSPRSRRT